VTIDVEAVGSGADPLDPSAELYSAVEGQPASDVPIKNAGVETPHNTPKKP
jgi:hypothetical protein